MSDFLFSIGCDAAQADAAVAEFVKRTNATLNNIQKVQYASSAGAKQAIENQTRLLKISEQRLAMEEKIAAAQAKNRTSAVNAVSGGNMPDISGVATRNAGAIGKQKDALDFLNRIMGNTVFKFVEYELVMKAFNGAVGEVFNSLNEASNVQMETTLQKIYNSQINTNQALKDAIIIAKQWGSDITDVQQAIGLWTKQTSQMHDATGRLVDSQTALAAAAKLAADAEKFHRASGIDSLEVYEKSVSIWHELGLSLGQIPHLYDQIALAATKISPVLKAQSGTTSKQEGIKDIFEGVAESGATLRAQGMDDSLIIATVAKQIENLGSTGAKVGTQVSTMFGSLNQGGKQLKEWVKILGPDAFKDSEHFMDAAISKVDELKQAQADGLLHVKPQTMNTWRTFIETLAQVKQLADDIRGHSEGILDKIAGAQMNTYNGQVDRLKSSFQELNLALGTELLPGVTRFISLLSGSALPAIAANSGAVVKLTIGLTELGVAYLAMLGMSKVTGVLTAFAGEAQTAAIVAREFGVAQLGTVPAMEAAEVQMMREQEALGVLQRQLAVVEWQTGGLAKACAALGVTEGDLAVVTGTKLPGALTVAGSAMAAFASKVLTVLGPLLKVYGVMQLIQAGVGVFDDAGNASNVLNAKLLQKEGAGQEWASTLNPLNFASNVQNLFSTVLGKDSAGNTFFANDLKRNATLRDLNSEFNKANESGDKGRANDLRQQMVNLLRQDYTEQHSQNVKGYDQLDKIDKTLQDEMNHLMGGTPAGMTMPGDLSKDKTKGQATEQQIAAEQTNKIKADAMAEISRWRDTANAAGSYAKTLMDIGKASGFTDPLLAKIVGHLNDQKTALENGENAAMREIQALTTQQKHLDDLLKSHGAHLDAKGNVHGGDKSAAVYAEAKSWRMAEEAITKATGALNLYEASKAKLSMESATMLGEAKAWAAIHDAISNQPKTIGSVSSTHSLSFLGYKGIVGSGSAPNEPLSSPEALDTYIKGLDQNLSQATTTVQKFNIATSQVSTLKELGATIFKLYTQTKDPQELLAYSKALSEIDKAGSTAAKGIVEANKATSDFDKNLENLIAKTAASDAEGIGKLLGLSPGDIDAQKTLIDGYNQINDDLRQIDQWVTQQAGSYNGLDATQKSMVQNAVNYLNIQQQLIPLLAQQQTIQSSIAYQALQTTLEKTGEEQLDQTINRLMGTQSNMKVRQQLYDQAKNGEYMSAPQTMLKDYLTNTLGAWWKQTAQTMTNAMFGNPAAQARNLEAAMLKTNRDGLTKIVQDEKTQVVDQLFSWEKLFAADVNKLVQAQQQANSNGGGGSGNGNDNNGGDNSGDGNSSDSKTGGSTGSNPANPNERGSESNPIYVSSYGDQGTGLFSGTTSKGNMADAVAQGLDNSETLKTVADNTGSLSDTASSAASTVQTVAQQQASSPSGSSGGGLLASLLGPLAQIPGLQKFLSSTGGQALNGALNAAGGGYGWGEAFGGAGSTNGDWGAVGGLVGYGAGYALGGPAGAAIGGEIGGLFGGLFGHKVNPLDEPDVYDTQNYGKFVANVNGAPGTFNGVTIAPDPQYDIADGGTPLDKLMATWAQKNPNNPVAKQLIALGPKLDIASEYQGIFTLGSGKTISVTAYEQLVQQYLAAAGNQQNAPIVSVNSYGGGSSANPYGTPGMDSSTFLAEEAAWASGVDGTTGYQSPLGGGGSQGGGGGSGGGGAGGAYVPGGSASIFTGAVAPTSTPGYGGVALGRAYGSNASLTNIRLQFTTPVYLDGKLLTQIVNAYNAQAKSDSGAVGKQPYA